MPPVMKHVSLVLLASSFSSERNKSRSHIVSMSDYSPDLWGGWLSKARCGRLEPLWASPAVGPINLPLSNMCSMNSSSLSSCFCAFFVNTLLDYWVYAWQMPYSSLDASITTAACFGWHIRYQSLTIPNPWKYWLSSNASLLAYDSCSRMRSFWIWKVATS